jgi:hypothetical protein
VPLESRHSVGTREQEVRHAPRREALHDLVTAEIRRLGCSPMWCHNIKMKIETTMVKSSKQLSNVGAVGEFFHVFGSTFIRAEVEF